MPQPLPRNSYLFAKLDTQFRYEYINKPYEDYFDCDLESLKRSSFRDAKAPNMPKAIKEKVIGDVSNKGFGCILMRHNHNNGGEHWGILDLTRRFGAAANSGMIGYEYVSYPASQAAIDFFAPIYDEMQLLERQSPGSGGQDVALAHLTQTIEQTGKGYDELVHTLQNS